MRDPFTGRMNMHYGVDFAAQRDVAVVAGADGLVIVVEENRQWGWRVRIQHKYNISTVYAHLGSVSVGKGKKVKRGERIGSIGVTGLSTGPHLHYEIWCRGQAVDAMMLIFPEQVAESAGGTVQRL
jgi:murein DD-endopeptidase MepM/ murein hydrolase activator NlpD